MDYTMDYEYTDSVGLYKEFLDEYYPIFRKYNKEEFEVLLENTWDKVVNKKENKFKIELPEDIW